MPNAKAPTAEELESAMQALLNLAHQQKKSTNPSAFGDALAFFLGSLQHQSSQSPAFARRVANSIQITTTYLHEAEERRQQRQQEQAATGA